MGISGKILGSAAGFAIGGPLGALMGVAAGHAYDRFRDEQREAETGEPSLAKQTAFAIAIIALCAKMAKADGFVSVRTLAEREGLSFVEGVRPRG